MTVGIAGLLLIPFLATNLSKEVAWSGGDFVLLGMVLSGLAVTYEVATQRAQKKSYRAAMILAAMTAFLLFWVNGAVGIIGSEDQPANLLYGAVFLVGLTGALLSRLRAQGMARTLWIAAGVQLLIPGVAWLQWPQLSWGGAGVVGVLLFNAFFTLLLAVAGWLFWRARE